MASAGSNAAGSLDGPNKKCRVQELFQLPDSLDDAMLQPCTVTAQQQQLPADEARRQLGTLQLGSADDPSSPRSAIAPAEIADAKAPASVPASNPSARVHLQRKDNATANGSEAGPSGLRAAAPSGEPAAALPYHREPSVEPAASDPGVCISLDMAAGSSALEGLARDDGEGEVMSRRAALAGGAAIGPNGTRGAAGFEVFVGGLPPDAREEVVRAALGQLGGGEVLSVRLQLTRGTSICKGYGFATFADEAAGQRAVGEAAAGKAFICGRRVGLHPSRRPFRTFLAASQSAAAQSPLQLNPDPSASINALLGALRTHPDKRAAVAAALQVIQRGAKRTYASTVAASTAPPASHVDGAAVVQPPAAQRTANTGKRQATASAAAVAGPTETPASASPAAAGTAAATTAKGGVEAGAAAEGAAPAAGHPAKAAKAAPDGAAAASAAKANANSAPGNTVAAAAAAKPTTEGSAAAGKADKPPASGTAGGGGGASNAGATAAGAGAAAAATTTGPGKKAPGPAGQASGSGQAPAKDKEKAKEKDKAPPGPSQDLLAALAAYPKISKLLESLKGANRVPKTALMVLHEYATKMSYEVSYLETSEGPAGPYTVDARLKSGGQHPATVVAASGKARTKKDAKQVAAAAVLEKLMEGPRGLSPQELLPAPKAATAAVGRGGKAGQERSGAAYNGPGPSSGGKKQPPTGRQGGGPPPGGHPPNHREPPPYRELPPHREPPPHRDLPPHREPPPIYRGGPPPSVLLPPPPPPPPSHGSLMTARGHPGSSYGGGGGSHGGRGPFSGGGAGGGGAGGGYSLVQPGLMPAGGPGGGPGRSGVGTGGGHPSGSFVGQHPADGRGPPGRGQHGGGGEAYGEPYVGPYGSAGGSGAVGYGGLGPAGGHSNAGPGGGGSMVQLGLGRPGAGGAPASGASGGQYGSLYGRDGGTGLDSYGGSSSYDMAAGQKRTYSTAMQAAYGTPASNQGLLPVRPPQHPAVGAGGAVLGGPAGGATDAFAAQAGGRGFPTTQQAPAQQQSIITQAQATSQNIFGQAQLAAQGQSAYAQPPSQQQAVFAQPTAAGALQATVLQGSQYGGLQMQAQQQPQQQQAVLSMSSAGGGGGASVYGMSQTVQLQPAQTQPIFPAGQAQSAAAQSGLYGMGTVQQTQIQPAQLYGSVQQQSGGLFGATPAQQQAPLASLYGMGQQVTQAHSEQQQQYGMGSTATVPGLQGFGAVRPGGSLWG